MPLHTIPLCSFSYVGDTLFSTEFAYDTRENINKSKNTLLYEANPQEIEVNHSKLLYKEFGNINKEKERLLYSEDLEVDKTVQKLLYMKDTEINRETNKALKKNDLEFSENKTYQLKDRDTEINKAKLVNLDANIDLGLTKPNIYQCSRNNLEFIKAKEFVLDKVIKYKEISKENKVIELGRIDTSNIDKLSFYNLFIELNQMNYSIYNKYLYAETDKQIYKEINTIYLDRDKIKNLRMCENPLYNYKGIDVPIFLNNILSVDNVQGKDIDKNVIYKFIYKDYKNILTNNSNKNITDITIANISKDKSDRLMYKRIIKNIDLFKIDKLLYKDVLRDISIDKLYKLVYKSDAKNIDLSNTLGLIKSKNIDIVKDNLKFIQNISYRDIYKDNFYGLNQSDIDITKNIYNITDLEVIKRWWVLGATEPTDLKILPIDYDYSKGLLQANRRDRQYGWLTTQDKHPISFMPYLENNMGIDLAYGLNEINLSIEIMIDMVNIVGMIVEHGASQFINASGQEVMEFIMEVLLDWLNLDTTVQEMNVKGSREHYLRAYRWIRWEAEKIWFIADKDHSQDRMMGIKYAGMLFSNLLDYMKNHHFDIVPLWRNIKYMDIERQFSRIATNGDIMKDLNKLKGNRHYSVETQNLERNILGGR